MRSAIIGVYFATEPERMREFVRASTLLTHSDPKAVVGALAVAELAGWSVRNPTVSKPDIDEVLSLLRALSDEPEWNSILDRTAAAHEQKIPAEEFAKEFRRLLPPF